MQKVLLCLVASSALVPTTAMDPVNAPLELAPSGLIVMDLRMTDSTSPGAHRRATACAWPRPLPPEASAGLGSSPFQGSSRSLLTWHVGTMTTSRPSFQIACTERQAINATRSGTCPALVAPSFVHPFVLDQEEMMPFSAPRQNPPCYSLLWIRQSVTKRMTKKEIRCKHPGGINALKGSRYP